MPKIAQNRKKWHAIKRETKVYVYVLIKLFLLVILKFLLVDLAQYRMHLTPDHITYLAFDRALLVSLVYHIPPTAPGVQLITDLTPS